jgi:hypothetical protein
MSQQKVKLNINIATLPNVVCKRCKRDKFEQVFILKHLSALQSPAGQPGFIPVPIFRCIRCREVLDGSQETK